MALATRHGEKRYHRFFELLASPLLREEGTRGHCVLHGVSLSKPLLHLRHEHVVLALVFHCVPHPQVPEISMTEFL